MIEGSRQWLVLSVLSILLDAASSFNKEDFFWTISFQCFFFLPHCPKLPKLGKACDLGCDMAEPMLILAAPGRPKPADAMFIPIKPGLAVIPPTAMELIPMLLVAIVGGVTIPMLPLATTGFMAGLAGTSWVLSVIPAKFCATRLTGGWTPE